MEGANKLHSNHLGLNDNNLLNKILDNNKQLENKLNSLSNKYKTNKNNRS